LIEPTVLCIDLELTNLYAQPRKMTTVAWPKVLHQATRHPDYILNPLEGAGVADPAGGGIDEIIAATQHPQSW
jgi:hypothetical protein